MNSVICRNVTASIIPSLCLSLFLSTSLSSIPATPNSSPQFAECSLIKPGITMSSQVMSKKNTWNTIQVADRYSQRISYEDALSLFGNMRAMNEDELYDYNNVISMHFVKVSDTHNFFDI